MKTVQNKKSKQEVIEFYNTFKHDQTKLGVNIRHRTIFKNLKKAGLKNDSKVLEIGCGIGTVSSLILNHIRAGFFVGVDISDKSIEMAQKLYANFKNAEFIVNDMATFSHSLKFDFVLMPDVLEHIPVEQHASIFNLINTITTDNATILINIPEPNCLNWIRINLPEKLQIIDQSLSMQDLLNSAYPSGFKLFSMNSYSLQYKQEDYTSIIFKKNNLIENYQIKNKLILGVQNFLSKLF